MSKSVIEPGATVGFVGLGRMGRPMAARLAGAGYRVRGYDVSGPAAKAWAEHVADDGVANESVANQSAADDGAALAVSDLDQVAGGAAAVVLMLPDSAVVTDVLLGQGLLAALPPGIVIVDMSSSAPRSTRELAGQAAARGVALVDAPVSGGVRGAEQGSLTVMVGGTEADVRRVAPLLDVMGGRVTHVGDVGAGHAVKALNNLMSATHLLVTSEAMAAAAEFGLDIPTVLAAVNTSSGRSGSTENKWPNFIVPRTFDSGFALRLMLKDMRIALDLAESAQTPARLSAAAVALWATAAEALPPDADHTEIARWLDPALRPESP